MKKVLKITSLGAIILSITLILCACSTKEKKEMFYYNDKSELIFTELEKNQTDIIDGHEKKNLALYTLKYIVKEENYPNSSNQDIQIPSYKIDDSDYVLAMRANYDNKFETSIKGFNDFIIFNSSDLKFIDGKSEIQIQYVIDGSRVNNIDVDTKITEIPESSVYNSIDVKEDISLLASEIRNNLPKEKRDIVRDVAYEYIRWITSNLNYPLDCDGFSSNYLNLSDPSKTIEYKVGVCEDFSNLLVNMLLSQGIEARSTRCYVQLNPYDYKNSMEDYGGHRIVEVHIDNKWYVLNPTLFSADVAKTIVLDNKTIEVLSPLKIEDVPIQYYCLEFLIEPNKKGSHSFYEFELYDIDMYYFD